MINKKLGLVAMVLVAVVLVSGCAQQPAQNATTSPTSTAVKEVKSQEDVTSAVTDTSANVKKISDTLKDIDKTLAGK